MRKQAAGVCLRALGAMPWSPRQGDISSNGKESACDAGDQSLIPGLGRSHGEGNGYPLQYSVLENSMEGGAWWVYSPRGRKESDTTERLTLSLLLRV